MYQGLGQMLTKCLQHHQGCSETPKSADVNVICEWPLKWCLKRIVMSRPRSSRWFLNLIKSDLILTPGPRGPGPRCPVASVPAPAPMLPMCVTAAAEIPSPSSANKSDTHFVSILDSWQTTVLAAGPRLGRSLKTKPLELYFNANKRWTM